MPKRDDDYKQILIMHFVLKKAFKEVIKIQNSKAGKQTLKEFLDEL